jgi:hypothetical protein
MGTEKKIKYVIRPKIKDSLMKHECTWRDERRRE